MNPRPSYYSQIRIDPKDKSRVYILGSNRGFYISDDAGRNFISLAPGDVSRRAELAAAYGRAGRKKEAEEIISEFEQMKNGPYISAYDWAMAYSGLGNKEQTLMWLQKAYEERNGRLANLGVHPQFAFLRKEPAFQQLIANWTAAQTTAAK